jgi:endonuclease III
MNSKPKRITKKQKALEILDRLKHLYPDATCSLDYTTPIQLLVATILSAQCTDERVNKVTPALFARFPDARSMAYADILEIEQLVRSTDSIITKPRIFKVPVVRLSKNLTVKSPKKWNNYSPYQA